MTSTTKERYYYLGYDDYHEEGFIIYDRNSTCECNRVFLKIEGATGKNRERVKQIVDALNVAEEK